MLAFKCDVCGKLFEEEKRYNTLRICCKQAKYLVSDGKLAIRCHVSLSKTDREIEEREYNVCPRCMDSILSLMQVLKPENHIIN